MSGGLPRDLIRVCRIVFEYRGVQANQNGLSILSEMIVRADIVAKMRAMAVAVQLLSQSSQATSFLTTISSNSLQTSNEVWIRIETLEALLNDIASADGIPDQMVRIKALTTEALVFLYFAVTVLEVFGKMDELNWRKGEDQKLFDQLAAARAQRRNPKAHRRQ
jgi:hypothetical protein